MAIVRIMIIGFVVLSIVYLSLSLYAHAARRERLEAEWDQSKGSRAAFVRAGMRSYSAALRPKLIAIVYVVPALLGAAYIYMTNFA